jgi:hypothetical protein
MGSHIFAWLALKRDPLDIAPLSHWDSRHASPSPARSFFLTNGTRTTGELHAKKKGSGHTSASFPASFPSQKLTQNVSQT